MKALRITALVALAATLAMVIPTGASATTRNLLLERDGSLYRLATVDDQLNVEISTPDGATSTIIVPNTQGLPVARPRLAIVPGTGTLIAAWEESYESGWSQIMLASYHAGSWWGPVRIAGAAGLPARNPSLMVHTATSIVEDGSEITTTFIDLAWWVGGSGGDDTHAEYGSLVLGDDGFPDLESLDLRPLRGMLGFGVVCGSTSPDAAVAQPMLFRDIDHHLPHVLFFDTGSCSFHIIELDSVLDDTPDAISQRRRHVIVFGAQLDMGLPSHIPPVGTEFVVGQNLRLAAYWDVDGGVSYLNVDEGGWSETRTLATGPNLSHEEAVDLIRSLTR